MVRDPRGFYGQYPSSLNVSDVGPPSKVPTDGPNHVGDLIELREGPANLRETRLTCHVMTGPSQPPPGWYPDRCTHVGRRNLDRVRRFANGDRRGFHRTAGFSRMSTPRTGIRIRETA